MAKQSPTCPTPAWLKPVVRFLHPVAWVLTFMWRWTRMMSYLRQDDTLPKNPWVHWTQTWLPRMIGLSAILGLAWAFYCAATPYPDRSQGPGRVLMVFALLSLIGAVVFLVFTITRRGLAKRLTKPLVRHRLTAAVGQQP